jgi:Rod binding domain-containing protein
MSATSALPGLDVQTLNAARPTKSFDVHSPKSMAALRKVGEEFEASFLSQMLGHMFAGTKSDEMFGGGQAEEMYRSLMVDEYGKSIAKSGGIGVADQVVRSVMMQFQEVGHDVKSRSASE